RASISPRRRARCGVAYPLPRPRMGAAFAGVAIAALLRRRRARVPPELSGSLRSGGEPRDPASDFVRVLLVRRAETPAKIGFLVPDHEEVGHYKECGPVDDEIARARDHRFAEHDRGYGEIHWVAHMAVQTSDDEMPRRINWRQRPASRAREFPNAR